MFSGCRCIGVSVCASAIEVCEHDTSLSHKSFEGFHQIYYNFSALWDEILSPHHEE